MVSDGSQISDRPVLGMWLQYAIALGSIWLVCELLRARRALIIRFSLHGARALPCTIPPGIKVFFRLLRCSLS